MIFSTDQVLALAPDPITRKNAYNFARARQWASLEGNEKLLWGLCKTRYRTFKTWVSLQPQKFKCSCNSTMPCRHALGLLLIYLQQSESFRVTYDIPPNIQAWLEGKTIVTKPKVDPQRAEQNRQNRLRNWEKRMESMAAGLDELETWLQDAMQQGLASLENQAPEFWDSIASRLVDTKLGSIARRIRMLPVLIQTSDDWHQTVFQEFGELYLIIRSFRNMDKLPDALQQEMFNLAGVNVKKADLYPQKGVLDNWIVLGQVHTKEENLTARRTWLLGEKSKKWALFLDFAWGGMGFEQDWVLGKYLQAELIFYPAAYPLRALAKRHEYLPRDLEPIPAYPTIHAFGQAYTKAIAANPWVRQFPVCIKKCTPIKIEEQLFLVDEHQQSLPIRADEMTQWKLMALSGGHPMRLFGEWYDQTFVPLSAWAEGRLVVL